MSIPPIAASDLRSALPAQDTAQAAYLDAIFNDLAAQIPVVNITPAITIAANWTLAASNAQVWGHIVKLYYDVTYTGTAIAAHATGDITNVTIGTLVPAVPYPAIGASAANYYFIPNSLPITAAGAVVLGGTVYNRIYATGTRMVGSAVWIA